MSDLTLFVQETDLKDLSEGQLAKIQEILLRSQKSTLAQVEAINDALSMINDARGGGGGTTTKKTKKNH